MLIPDHSLARRLHRYGFLVTADIAAAGRVLDRLAVRDTTKTTAGPTFSRDREIFRQFTGDLKSQAPSAQTNLRFMPASAPISPASFAAALWGLPFTSRAIVVLVCVEGFSLAEAAFIAGLPLARAEHFMLYGLLAFGADAP